MVLSRWGIRSNYCGVMGAYSPGDELKSWMQSVGLDTGGVVTRKISTRISYVIMDEGERTILDMRNPSAPEAELQDNDWQNILGINRAMDQTKAVMVDKYCSAVHNRIKQMVKLRRSTGERPVLIYRTGSRPSQSFEVENGILPDADIVLTKSTFLESIDAGQDAVEGCRLLSERFKIPVVVATSGKDGAAYFDRKRNAGGVIPALPVEKPATTLGGGDFFRAGFLLAYLEGKTLEESVRTGNAAAAVHISRPEEEKVDSVFFSRQMLERAGK
jgi:sugar/nucleoside kinase (ribokinase family)